MIFLLLLCVVCGVFGAACAYVSVSDRLGKFYCPEDLNRRQGWIHDGKLYTYNHTETEFLEETK